MQPRTIARRRATLLLLALLAACAAQPEVTDSRPTAVPGGADNSRPDGVENAASDGLDACGPAPFVPSALPWDEAAGEPDAVVHETDSGWGQGVTSMWWWQRQPAVEPDGAGTLPWSGGGSANRYVVLQRGVDAHALARRGLDVSQMPTPDGEVRGHPAAFAPTGDPGVGAAWLHWAEAEDRCDHYLLLVQPWDTEEELWSLRPPEADLRR